MVETLIWYRSLTPDGDLWTESRSLDEIDREAEKFDPSDGPLIVQTRTEIIIHSYSNWENLD